MAVSSLFIEKQLEHVQSEVVNQDFPERMIASGQAIPIDTSLPAWSENYAYRLFTKVGSAKILANGSEDLPEVGAYVEKRYGTIRTVANAFSYSYQDFENANFAGVNIDADLAIAAREIMEAEIDDIGYLGRTDFNLLGLLNHPNVPTYTVANDGTGSATAWSTKTADKIYRDLRAFAAETRSQTKRVESPDVIAMPSAQFDLIAETEYPSNTGKTILSFFLENQKLVPGGVREIIPMPFLEGQGTSGADLMISFRRRPDKIVYHIPQDFTMLPMQQKGLTYTVPCLQRVGGVQLKKIYSMRYASGI